MKSNSLKSLPNDIFLDRTEFKEFADDINSSPNYTILDQSKLKAIADDTSKVIQMANFVLDRIENIVGKEENAGYQYFLLFPQCFQKALSSRSLKVRIVW